VFLYVHLAWRTNVVTYTPRPYLPQEESWARVRNNGLVTLNGVWRDRAVDAGTHYPQEIRRTSHGASKTRPRYKKRSPDSGAALPYEGVQSDHACQWCAWLLKEPTIPLKNALREAKSHFKQNPTTARQAAVTAAEGALKAKRTLVIQGYAPIGVAPSKRAMMYCHTCSIKLCVRCWGPFHDIPSPTREDAEGEEEDAVHKHVFAAAGALVP